MAESGYPGFTITAWHGVVTTGGTPAELVGQLAAEVAAALRDPDVQARFDSLAAERVGSTPLEFRAFLARERARFAALIRERNIKPES